MEYQQLTKDTIKDYVMQYPSAAEALGGAKEIAIEEIGDGNLNYVYRLRNAAAHNKSVIVKQAVPYLRMAGEDWPLSRNRMDFEIRALQFYNELVPSFVPKIYHADEDMSVIIMQDLRDHNVIRYRMIEGEVFPRIGEDVGKFLAETLFRTSGFGMDSLERRRLMQKFNLNDELCKLTEEFIFTFPYMEHDSNYDNPKTSDYARQTIRQDREYKLRVLKFKELFLTKADALLHADLHTGSLMGNTDETYVIDMEFAYFGPFGFDVGKIMANFFMAFTSHYYHSDDATYQGWLMEEAFKIWDRFESGFLKLWGEQERSAMLEVGMLSDEELAAYKKSFMKRLLQETVGFCACSLARRTLGIAGVPDIRKIEDEDLRSTLEITNLKLSQKLMMSYDTIETVGQFRDIVEQFYTDTNLSYMEKS
ncbi:MAG: S-methyl-5-thioribose kinase [Pseudomonadota bacterium]